MGALLHIKLTPFRVWGHGSTALLRKLQLKRKCQNQGLPCSNRYTSPTCHWIPFLKPGTDSPWNDGSFEVYWGSVAQKMSPREAIKVQQVTFLKYFSQYG